jgi:Integrin beta chain VWA domain
MHQQLHEKATAIAKKHHIKDPVVIDSTEAQHPESDTPIYRVRLVPAADANGSALSLFLNEQGQEQTQPSDALLQAFDSHIVTVTGTPRTAAVTIQPDTNVLRLRPDQALNETLTVNIPKGAGPGKADVYLLADTTGSMRPILTAVRAAANNILAALAALPADIAYGVGNYKDFAQGTHPYGFQHQLSPTSSTTAVTAAINTWSASGGGDTPEAALFALHSLAVAPGAGIGWRSKSKRIIVWFGDAPSHDPICTEISGAPTVTEANATQALVTQGITVLAISTATPGLDGDPKVDAGGYKDKCGAPGGEPGQATRITSATGGSLATGIHAGNIVATIIKLVQAAVDEIQNIALVPSPSVGPYVKSISPPGGYGPLSVEQNHSLSFGVTFSGMPAQPDRPSHYRHDRCGGRPEDRSHQTSANHHSRKRCHLFGEVHLRSSIRVRRLRARCTGALCHRDQYSQLLAQTHRDRQTVRAAGPWRHPTAARERPSTEQPASGHACGANRDHRQLLPNRRTAPR